MTYIAPGNWKKFAGELSECIHPNDKSTLYECKFSNQTSIHFRTLYCHVQCI